MKTSHEARNTSKQNFGFSCTILLSRCSLKQAWADDSYWFSIEELRFIMTLTCCDVRFYVVTEEGFAETDEALSAVSGTSSQARRVVYEGDSRGLFWRLLSATEWQARDMCDDAAQGDENAVGATLGFRSCSSSSSSTDLSDIDSEAAREKESKAAADDNATTGSPIANCPAGIHDDPAVPVADPEVMAAEDVSDLDWQDEDDISENSDVFNVEVDEGKEFTTPEDRLLERVDRLAEQLRDHPLLPLDPKQPDVPFSDTHSGVRLPLLHCAFKGCTWTKEAKGADDKMLLHWGMEWALFCHLLEAHNDAFDEEFELCGIEDRASWSNLTRALEWKNKGHGEKWQDDLFLHVISSYTKAMSVRLQEGMPDVGPCVDRRVLRGLNTMLPEVKAMVCFCCAQIHSHVPLWRAMYAPGQHGLHKVPQHTSISWQEPLHRSEHKHAHHSKNMIEMYGVRSSLRAFFLRNEDKFRLHFGLREFKLRYASDLQPQGNPFKNATCLSESEAEWVQRLVLEGVEEDVFLLCCPEDVDKCKACARQGNRLCEACRIPLCQECSRCIVVGATSEIPMALANDNFWGYTSEIIFKYKVRYLEMAIVQPCWTTMMVCYVEGDHGHLLNEVVDQQQFRTKVRGTAHSFHMPWEEILEELQRNFLDKAILHPLPRKAECLKYMLRVHLRVGRRDMESALRQLAVRPYVLLQLLYFLIDHNHVVFRGRGNAQQLRQEMQAAVDREYPVPLEEQKRPLVEQECALPFDFLSSLEDSHVVQIKRRTLLKEKNATPGEGELPLDSFLEDHRPSSVVNENCGAACSDPATLRTSTITKFGPSEQGACLEGGKISVQTGQEPLPQWNGQYFSQVLPFAIPYMVSGPDFEFHNVQKRWRRGTVGGSQSARFLPAPLVPAKKFCSAFSRRVESQCRRSWEALPVIRSVIYKYNVETAGHIIMRPFQRRPESTLDTSAEQIVKDAQVLVEKLW